jgi:hypothetical protein
MSYLHCAFFRAEQEKKLAQQKKEEEERLRKEEAEKKAKASQRFNQNIAPILDWYLISAVNGYLALLNVLCSPTVLKPRGSSEVLPVMVIVVIW